MDIKRKDINLLIVIISGIIDDFISIFKLLWILWNSYKAYILPLHLKEKEALNVKKSFLLFGFGQVWSRSSLDGYLVNYQALVLQCELIHRSFPS